MSTQTCFVDEKECEYAIEQVRSDNAAERFLVLGHPDNNPNALELICTGNDTADITNHMDDEAILYILARYDTTFDMSNTVKFVYIRWVGEHVPIVKKGKFSVVKGSIVEKIGQSHMGMETGSRDDVMDDYIQQKLAETAGNVSRVLDSTDGHQQRGFTASQTTQRTKKSTGLVQTNYSNTKPSIELEEELAEMIETVHNDMNQTTWCLGCYDSAQKGFIAKVASGSGDLMELKSNLDPALVMYGLYRVTDVVDEIQTVKFAFIMWVGPDVKPFLKAKVSTHRGVIEDQFKPVHVSVIASELSEISDKIVMNKVMSASGSKSMVK